MLEKRKQFEGKYSFTANMNGMHSICFSNKMSSISKKDISVDINVGKTENYSDLIDSSQLLTPLGNQIMELSSSLVSIHSEQKYMKMREQRHKLTNESTSRSVMWWSVTETLLLVGVSFFQLYYLRKFFEDKRSL